MNDSKYVPIKLFVSIIIPLLTVTLGGIMVYGTFDAFFFPTTNQTTSEVNGPAAIYYGLTLVIALMFFFMRQGYKWYEFVTIGVMSLVFSFSMQKMTPTVFRPIYLYILPLLIFFILIWLIMKYIFLNKHMRYARLLLFSVLGAAVFAIAFRIQFILLNQHISTTFMQSRFISGLMLMIFMGFGLSLSEFIIFKLEELKKERVPVTYIPKNGSDMDDDDEAN